MIGRENLICVPPSQIANVWPIVFPMIDKAYAEMDLVTPPDLRMWLAEERGLLWIMAILETFNTVVLAACTTSLVLGRSGLTCRIVACGGEKIEWEACMAKIEDYARSEGCYKVSFDGRRGWERVLSDYRPVCVSFEKRL